MAPPVIGVYGLGSSATAISPRDLSAISSEAPKPAEPARPKGDFSRGPVTYSRPAGMLKPEVKRTGFDPQRSRIVGSLTNPQRQVFENPDGSRTAKLSSGPVRFRDAQGAWTDIDLSLRPSGDGFLRPKAAPRDSRVADRSSGDLLAIPTAAGEFRFTVEGMTDVPAVVADRSARYAQALGAVRSVAVSLLTDGFEDEVDLAAPGSPNSYRVVFTVPEGVTARMVTPPASSRASGVDSVFGKSTSTNNDGVPPPSYVEFVGDAGVVGTYGFGSARDAKGAMAAVSSSLVGQAGRTITIENSVDPSWLASSSRVFPVAIDPYGSWGALTATTCPGSPYTASTYGGCDTYTNEGTPNSPYSGYSYMWSGCPCYPSTFRTATWLQFPTDSLGGTGFTVLDASLSLRVSGGQPYYRDTRLYAGISPPWSGLTWNNQVAPNEFADYYGSANYCGCAGTTASWNSSNSDVVDLVQEWFDGARPATDGVLIYPYWASATDPTYFREYYPSEVGSSLAPSLTVTYNRPPVVALSYPSNGSLVAGTTPTLSASGNDPDGNGLSYDFAVWDASTGAPAWESGWTSSNYVTVPAGLLSSRRVYAWQVAASDGVDVAYSTAWTFSGDNPPAMTTPASPGDGAIVLPDNVVLTVNPVSDPDPGDAVQYYFQVTSNSGTGAAVTSGFQSSTSFPVPSASLKDGTTYTWQAWTSDGTAVTSPNWSRTFKVDRRLGIVGPLPYDTVGPAAVNLFNGNLVVRTGSPTLPTVGGGVGLSYTYNSQAPLRRGLTGSYYTNCTNPSAGNWPAQASLTRLDPQVSFNWGFGSPASMISADDFCVRWVGYITPAQTGSYTFGAAADQGVKVTIGSNSQVVLDAWSTSASPNMYTPTFGSTSVTLTAGQPTPITVEYYDGGTSGGQSANGFVNLYQKLSGGSGYPVDPSWLTPDAPALPQGWSLSVDLGGASTYTAAQTSEGQVTLVDATGATHVFKASGSEYTSPADDPDSVLARDANGQLTLQRSDGSTYVFGVDGTLASLTFATDDRNPAATQLSWTGSPSRLRTMTDPVSNRAITLSYGGDQACGSAPSGTGLTVAPTGMLCHVHYWNGDDTSLWYDASGRLARIEDPGAEVTDFGYDANSRVTLVRDPLVADWCAVDPSTRCAADDTSEMTVVTYGASNRVASVRLPKGEPSDSTYSSHTYDYVSGTRTQVSVAGLSPARGYARQVDFDATGRLLTDTDATGVTRQATWDAGDRQLSATDPAGRVTNTIYDPTTKLRTDAYGPAVASCFTGQVPTAACQNTVAHSHTNYDEGVNGLAAVYFPNLLLKGAPKVHSTGVGRGAVNPVSVDTTGALAADWGSSGKPDASLTAGAWSARYTGDVTMPAVGAYQLQLNLGGYGRLYVDDVLLVDSWTDTNGLTSQGTVNNTTAGARHRVRVEFRPGAAGGRLELRWTPPGSTVGVLPASFLSPRYGLVTSTTSDDTTPGSSAMKTALAYDAPEYGLATSSTADPNGQALVTATSYEPSAAGNSRYLRPVSRWLPAGNRSDTATATTYKYYGADSSAAVANPCAGGAAIDQGGALWTRTQPDPDGTGPGQPRVEEFVYDRSGRVAASRVGVDSWTCLTYDDRGRPLTASIPAGNGQPARTVAHLHAVGGNPLVSSVSDAAGTITTTIDLLGRVVSYTDVWGKTTTTSYDQAGRPLSVNDTAGSHTFVYDDAGRVTTEKIGGQPIATATYVNGELAGATYPSGAGNAGNGTSLAIGRAANTGSVTDLTWKKPDQSLLTSDSVTYSQSGRIVDETIDGTFDARPGNPNFAYDAVGRLTGAWVTGHTLSYAFSGSGGCGPNSAAGKNTNRTSAVDNGTTTSYCYDNADRLTSTTDARYGTIAYDAHGNTTSLGTSTFGYDQTDRHITTSVADESRPVITNVVATPSSTGVAITWTTDQSASSVVDWGTTPAMGTTKADATSVTAHSLSLTGLTCGSVYNYRVRSVNARDLSTAGPIGSFVTSSCPTITKVGAATGTTSTAPVTIALPPGRQVNDYALVGVLARYGASVATPAGWNLNRVAVSGGALLPTDAKLWVFDRVLDGSEASVRAGAASAESRIAVVVYRNVDSVNPIADNDVRGSLNGPKTSVSVSTITAPASSRLVALAGAANHAVSGGFSSPGMTKTASNEAALTTVDAFDQVWSAGGPTGARTFTFSQTGDLVAWLAALNLTTDMTAPAISGLATTATQNTSTVTWTTDEPASSVIEYGVTSAFGNSATTSGIGTSHVVNLASLICGTRYLYRVKTADAAGNLSDPPSGTFTTQPCTAGITLVSSGAAGGGSATSVSFPLAVRAGDQILIAATSPSTTPAGFTHVGSSNTMTVYRRTATGSEGPVTVSGTGIVSASMAVYRGVDASPVDTHAWVSTLGSSQVTASSITPSSTQTMLVLFGVATGNAVSGTWVFPSGMTKLEGTDAAAQASSAVAQQPWPTATGTGTRAINFTTSGALNAWFAALRRTTDVTPPVVSGVATTLSGTTGAVTWATSEMASSFVDYGLSTAYDLTVGDTDLVTGHSVQLSSLLCGATYHYRVRSADNVGNESVSPDATFTTPDCGPNAGVSITTYTRDALNRIVARTVNGVTTRYVFCGASDSPCATADGTNTVIEREFGLLGGAMVTKRSSGDVWSYPNIHGDVVATANAAGAKQGPTLTFDPYGQQASGTLPDNSSGNLDYGWLGSHQRVTEHEFADPTIEMGARIYVPGTGRFLQVDPIEGGSANNYDYVSNDPVNGLDLSGLCESGEAWCVIGILKGTESLPYFFHAWLKSTGNGNHKSTPLVQTSAGLRRIDREGSCSSPTGNTGATFDFTTACLTHDLGYDLMRFFNTSGANGSTRRAVDRLLGSDTAAHCGGRHWAIRGICHGWSKAFAAAVKANSALQSYGVPR
jgi:RHS repeat-associated protein